MSGLLLSAVMVEVFASLGSNRECKNNISSAVAELRRYFGVLRISPVYRSKAVGFDGDDFFNLVVAFHATETAEQVQEIFHQIEAEHGRKRDDKRFGPRSLDIDLILYGDCISAEPVPLPREDIIKYAFVLKPLADLVPEYQHPVIKESYATLWEGFTENHELQPLSWRP